MGGRDGTLKGGDLVVKIKNETLNNKRETFDVSRAFGDDPKVTIGTG